MNAKERSDFTQGSILKKMIPFMMPILGALILQAAYGAVDLLVVGRFGTTAGLSAVSTGSQILNLVTFVITQLAMGITVLIARYIGEKHTSQIGELLGGATTVFNYDSCRTLCGDGVFCKATGCSYAGTPRSAYTYVSVCKDLRGRYFLYRCL